MAADQHGLLIHVVNKFKPSWLLLSKQIIDVFLLRPLPAAILLFGNKKQLPLVQKERLDLPVKEKSQVKHLLKGTVS